MCSMNSFYSTVPPLMNDICILTSNLLRRHSGAKPSACVESPQALDNLKSHVQDLTKRSALELGGDEARHTSTNGATL